MLAFSCTEVWGGPLDRCFFVAIEFGVEKIWLVGFDFEDSYMNPTKKKSWNG